MISKTCICKKCEKEYIVTCTERQRISGKYKKYCSRSCANSRTFSTESNDKRRSSVLRYIQEHPESPFYRPTKTYNCKYCNEGFTMNSVRNTSGYNYCSTECRDKWLKENVYPKSGGYRKGSGRGKHGWYNGVYCDSSYELAYLIYSLDHNIDIKRCKTGYEYLISGKKHVYYPDFIVNGIIIEVKGYYTKSVDIKSTAITQPYKILYKKDIQKHIDYVCSTYNVTEKTIYTLYDDHKPNFTYICHQCGNTFTTDRDRHTDLIFCSRSCAGKYLAFKRHNS